MLIFNISYLEWIGYISSALVAVSLTMSSIVKLRWYNLLGSVIFTFYGFAIGSPPIGLLNMFIVAVNIYYLTKIYTHKVVFKLIPASLDNPYVQYFIDYNQKELNQFFPHVTESRIREFHDDEKTQSYLLVRDAFVTGLLIATQKGKDLLIHMDFVAKPYRDMKQGQFIYTNQVHFFKQMGVSCFIYESVHPLHKKYLQKLGFSSVSQKNQYTTFVKNV